MYFFMKRTITKLSLLFMLFSLLILASCKQDDPEADIIGFWKSTTATRQTVVELGKNYFVYYAAPTQVINAKRKGPIQIRYEQVGDGFQGLESSMNSPEVRIKNIDGDKAHIQVSSFKDDVVRIGADEANSLMAD